MLKFKKISSFCISSSLVFGGLFINTEKNAFAAMGLSGGLDQHQELGLSLELPQYQETGIQFESQQAQELPSAIQAIATHVRLDEQSNLYVDTNTQEYLICSKADLFSFKALAESTNDKLKIKLMDDVVLNDNVNIQLAHYEIGVASNKNCDYIRSLEHWSPINKNNTIIFDGNNHSIIGMAIFEPNKDNVGFFSKISLNSDFGPIGSCFIHNLNFVNAVVVGKNNVGIMAGLIEVNGDPSSNNHLGRQTILVNVFRDISVFGEVGSCGMNSAGLIGCFSIKLGQESQLGPIPATLVHQTDFNNPIYFSSFTIRNCHSFANVTGLDVVAGFLGKYEIKGCYNFSRHSDRCDPKGNPLVAKKPCIKSCSNNGNIMSGGQYVNAFFALTQDTSVGNYRP